MHPPVKIAICTPFHGDVTAEYTQSLANLLLFTTRQAINFNGAVVSPELKVFMKTSSLLPEARNLLADDALDWGANYLLWIDADQWFPEHSLLRLLSLNLPVVGVNYPRRIRPTWPTATGIDEQLIWTSEEAAREGRIDEVLTIGFGFCLVDINVIHALKRPEPDGTNLPLFMLGMSPGYKRILGEDVYFFDRVRSVGYSAHVDHALSWSIGHVSRLVLYNSHTIEDREHYERMQRPD